MQFQSGAKVETAAGDTAGHLDRVVIDPRTKEITHLVVRKGVLFKTDKVVPLELIDDTSSDEIRLRGDVDNLDGLPDFEEEHYVVTHESDWVRSGYAGTAEPLPASDRTPPGAGVAPTLLWYPPAAMGLTGGPALGAVPYQGPIPPTVEVRQNIPDETVGLKEGAKVLAMDGQQVGSLERLFADAESGRATHLLLSQGMLLKSRKVIPVAWVLSVGEDEVHLAVSSELLQGLAEYKE